MSTETGVFFWDFSYPFLNTTWILIGHTHVGMKRQILWPSLDQKALGKAHMLKCYNDIEGESVCMCVHTHAHERKRDKRETEGETVLIKEVERLLILVLALSREVEKKTKSSCNLNPHLNMGFQFTVFVWPERKNPKLNVWSIIKCRDTWQYTNHILSGGLPQQTATKFQITKIKNQNLKTMSENIIHEWHLAKIMKRSISS